MAFEFLKDIGGFVEDVGGVVGPASDILTQVQNITGAFQNRDVPVNDFTPEQALEYTRRPELPAENFLQEVIQAISDPDNPAMQEFQEEERQALMEALRSNIRSFERSSRRNAALGRPEVFFDPERRDEFISYAMQRGAPRIESQARQQAVQRFLDAAGLGQGLLPTQLARQEDQYGGAERMLTSQALGRERARQSLQQSAPQRQERDPFTEISKGLSEIVNVINSNSRTPPFFPQGKEGTYGPYRPPRFRPKVNIG